MADSTSTVSGHFTKAAPDVRATYEAVLKAWHHEVRLRTPSEVDRELRAWLERAYELAE